MTAIDLIKRRNRMLKASLKKTGEAVAPLTLENSSIGLPIPSWMNISKIDLAAVLERQGIKDTESGSIKYVDAFFLP